MEMERAKEVRDIDEVEFGKEASMSIDGVEAVISTETVYHPKVHTDRVYETDSSMLERMAIAYVEDGQDVIRDRQIHQVDMPNYYCEFADMEVPAVMGGRYPQAGYHPAGNIETVVRLLAGDGMYKYTELEGHIIKMSGSISEVMSIEYCGEMVLLAPYVSGRTRLDDGEDDTKDDVYEVDKLVEV